MKIDKSRFVLLTTSLAAASAAAVIAGSAGCTSTSTTSDAGATPDTGTTDSGGGDASDGAVACISDQGPSPTCEGLQVDGGVDASSADGGDGGAVDAGNTGPNQCYAQCTTYANSYKSQIATDIAQCLDIAPTCETAGPDCVDKALAKACDDPSAKTFCEPLVAGCAEAGATGLTQQSCEALVKGLNGVGRNEFKTCLTQEGAACIADPASCITQMKN